MSTRHRRLRRGAWLAAMLVTGCATTDDPHQGGLMGGMAGLSSGAYERRIQERQESLDRLKAAQAELQTEQAALETHRQAKQAQVDRLRQRLAGLDRDTKQLAAKVGRLRADDRAAQQRIADLRRRLAALQGRIGQTRQGADALEGSGMGDSGGDPRRRQLEEQRRQLEQEYKLLTDLYLQLGSG